MPTISTVTKEEYKEVIKAIYGSMEAYYNCPELKEVKTRILYLEMLKTSVNALIDKEKKETPRWNLASKLVQYFGGLFVPVFLNDMDKLIQRYYSIKSLPIKFSLHAANNTFDFFMDKWGGVIIKHNKKMNITNDPYIVKVKK
jgi:hypothetical protein